MVSIIPAYVYTLFAALVVGVLIVSSCSYATLNVRNEAEKQQLSNINEYVATQSLMLITDAAQGNQNVTQFLNLPSQVANQVYWVCISNNSGGIGVTSGFGSTVCLSQSGVAIPAKADASGVFVSTFGRPCLECFYVNQTTSLTLTSD